MAEKNVMSIFDDQALRKELTGEMSQVEDIKYIGHDMYSVKTEEGSYILELKKPVGSQKHEITIYSEKSHVTRFIYKWKTSRKKNFLLAFLIRPYILPHKHDIRDGKTN